MPSAWTTSRHYLPRPVRKDMTTKAMTPSQRAEYVRLSIATVDTLKAIEVAHAAPTLSPERRDRVVSIYRAGKAVV